MATKTFKFSVKSNVGRKSVDGPWKVSAEEAVAAFVATLAAKGIDGVVSRAFVAQQAPKETAPSGDGRHYYHEPAEFQGPWLMDRLTQAGVTVR